MHFIVLSLSLLLSFAAHAEPRSPREIPATALMRWLRKPWNEVACFWKSELGYEDKNFKCSKKEPPSGDVCKSPKKYYAGPAAPRELANRIQALPAPAEIELTWEHNQLQMLTLRFGEKVSLEALEKMLGVKLSPLQDEHNLAEANHPEQYPNVMSISVQASSKKGVSVLIQGFDHMGRADVECK